MVFPDIVKWEKAQKSFHLMDLVGHFPDSQKWGQTQKDAAPENDKINNLIGLFKLGHRMIFFLYLLYKEGSKLLQVFFMQAENNRGNLQIYELLSFNAIIAD